MLFVANSIVIGSTSVVAEKPIPSPITRNQEGSFQSLREKVYNQPSLSEIPTEMHSSTKQSTTPSRSPNYRKKAKGKDDELIQYKESAFLSDMLSSSKD